MSQVRHPAVTANATTTPTSRANRRPERLTSFLHPTESMMREWCEVETFFEQSDTRFMLSWDKISWYDYTDGSGACGYR
ncbi:MAG: hypothetical protein IPH10_08455 [bacterium]|nr:hypothetical protein [bacterium]